MTLCRQAPAFATSLNYAKLVTAVLTMYQNQVSKTRLGSCRPAGELQLTQDLAQRSQVGSWQCSSMSSLLLSIPGHPSPPEQSGCRSGSEQCGSEEVTAGCAGRSQVRWILRPPGWAGVSSMGGWQPPCSWSAPGGRKPASAGRSRPGAWSAVGFPFLDFSPFSLLLPGERQREPQGNGFLGQWMLIRWW